MQIPEVFGFAPDILQRPSAVVAAPAVSHRTLLLPALAGGATCRELHPSTLFLETKADNCLYLGRCGQLVRNGRPKAMLIVLLILLTYIVW